MEDGAQKIKPTTKFAGLKNVLAFMAQVRKLQDRPPGHPNIGVFYGFSGYGKSYASIYAQIKSNAVRVEVMRDWRLTNFLRAILQECGVAEPKGARAELVEQAIELLGEDMRRPLFVDEADWCVENNFIETVRQIADRAMIPVLLLGEEKLPEKLARIERVHNRVLDWTPAQPCDLNDCKLLAQVHAPGLALEDALLERFHLEGQGRARRVVISLAHAVDWARNKGATSITAASYDGEVYRGEAPRARQLKIVNGGRAA